MAQAIYCIPLLILERPSRLLKKGVQVGNIRFKSVEPGSCWGQLCRSHGTFSPFGFCGPALLGHRA